MTKPPFRVTLLLWLVLSLTLWNSLRLWTSLAWKDVIREYSTQLSPTVIIVSSSVWLVVGVILLWSIWQGKAWARRLLFGATAGYSLWYWSERLIWENPHPNWLFAVIVNLIIIIFVLFCMNSLTREAYERKIEHPTIE